MCVRPAIIRALALSAVLGGCAHGADWWQDSVGYEIFVRSFQDSNGDGIGDLAGIRERLDDLGALGVDLLWLTPIHPGPTYHGYAIADYRAVAPEYGTLADFDALITAAHARGMRVILDLVLNHTADTHPWFEQRRDWYVWRDRDPGWHQVWSDRPTWFERNGSFYYALFGPGMPDLDYTNLAVEAEMLDVAAFWLAHGADGFRLDAVRYLVETGAGPMGQADTAATHGFLKKLRARVDRERPNVLLAGEVWESDRIIAPYFGTGDAPELDMAFDFTAAGAILDAIAAEDGRPIARALEERLAVFPPRSVAGTFLTNHDQSRLATKVKDPKARELAAAILLTMPGTPWIYYGEEIGMEDGPSIGGDLEKRRPMAWSAISKRSFTESEAPWIAPVDVEPGEAASSLARYRELIALRRSSPILRRGSLEVVHAEGSTSAPLVIRRKLGEKAVILIYNFGSVENEVRIGERRATVPARTYLIQW